MESHGWACGICHGEAESENIVVEVEESVNRDEGDLLDIEIH